MIEWFAPAPFRHDRPIGAFVDRDGVINEHVAGGYVLRGDEFRYLPGAIESLWRLGQSGRALVVVSNQSCVNRGLLAATTLREIMTQMVETLHTAGVRFSGWICCPHRPDEGCACRKPGIAMLERAAQVTGVRLRDSDFFGDSETDMQAARRAGMRAVLVERNAHRALADAADGVLRGQP